MVFCFVYFAFLVYFSYEIYVVVKVLLENGWISKQMIEEGETAIPLETALHAFRNQEKIKQRSTIMRFPCLLPYHLKNVKHRNKL